MMQSPPRDNFFGTHKAKRHKNVPKSSRLKVKVQVTWLDGTTKYLRALVDTGAEMNLINPSVMDSSLFRPSKHPIRLGVANTLHLQDGGREVTTLLSFQGVE